jgi:hypothetical protein
MLTMSAVSDFLTEPSFWWGSLAGSCVTAVIAPLITARSVRASDRRKATQENAMQDRKEKHEAKLRDEESLYTVAMDYAGVCTEVLENTIDIKGAFNAIRDFVYNQAGADDPKADDKFDHALKASEEMKRIMKPYNKMRLIAPANVIDAAVDVNAALLAVLRATTEPFAQPVTRKAAGDAIEKFINVFRAEIGKDMYTASKAQERATSFLANLKTQVHDYMEESKAEMKAAGFKTTPWDQPSVNDESPEPGGDEARRFDLFEPGAAPITMLKAGELTEEHVGKFVGCHDPAGFNYGAEILKVVRVEEGSRPGMLVRIQHPPTPSGKPARQERMLLKFDHEVELVDLSDLNPNGST